MAKLHGLGLGQLGLVVLIVGVCAVSGPIVWAASDHPDPRASKAGNKIREFCPSTTIRGLPADIDKAREARDYRPLSVASFWGGDRFPGITCPADLARALKPKGGIFYSDALTMCPSGWKEMSAQTQAEILAYNSQLASWPEFQAETGCGPSQ